MVPPAPGRLSTTTAWPKVAVRCAPSRAEGVGAAARRQGHDQADRLGRIWLGDGRHRHRGQHTKQQGHAAAPRARGAGQLRCVDLQRHIARMLMRKHGAWRICANTLRALVHARDVKTACRVSRCVTLVNQPGRCLTMIKFSESVCFRTDDTGCGHGVCAVSAGAESHENQGDREFEHRVQRRQGGAKDRRRVGGRAAGRAEHGRHIAGVDAVGARHRA